MARLQKFYRLLSNNEFFVGWQAIRIAHIRIAPTNTDLDKRELEFLFKLCWFGLGKVSQYHVAKRKIHLITIKFVLLVHIY
nr:hypothetical protein BCV36_21205 [Vibrio cyclitrophicus]